LTDFHTRLKFVPSTVSAAVQKMGTKGQVTLPKYVRDAPGLRAGDLLETVLIREGALTRPVELTSKKIDDLEEALAEAEADVKAGRVSKPYQSAHALVRDAVAAGRHRRRCAGAKS
jgi:AbrB family looped-hinge helix DNA binding protein